MKKSYFSCWGIFYADRFRLLFVFSFRLGEEKEKKTEGGGVSG
jgi:hypothetical protein